MKKNKLYRLDTQSWNIIRLVFLLGGLGVFASAVLALLVSFKFLYFTLFIGAMLINFSITGHCPMAIILKKVETRE